MENVSWYEAAAYANALSTKKGLTACYTDKGSGKTCTKHSDCNADEACRNKTTCIKYDVATAYSKDIFSCPGYRLPTEAEWEYAYRAGTTTAYYNGNNDPSACTGCSSKDKKLDIIGWYCANSDALYSGCISHNSRCLGPQPVGKKLANAWGLHDMAGNIGEWCHDWLGSTLRKSGTDPVGSLGTRAKRGGSFGSSASDARAARFNISHAIGNSYALGFRLARSVQK